MKNLLIAGNWKSNKTVAEAMEWLRTIKLETTARVILFAPFTLLYPLKQEIDRLRIPLELGAQDVSPFGDGAYTGEVNARQIKELADWVLIGHLERRTYFHETQDVLRQKVTRAKTAGLKVIYCLSNDGEVVPDHMDVVAFEPYDAILGSGKSEDPPRANEVLAQMNAAIRLYGGSVTPENVAAFVAQPAIDGVLVGGASLDPEKFSSLIAHAVV